jgi:hypothetical protein
MQRGKLVPHLGGKVGKKAPLDHCPARNAAQDLDVLF